MGIIRTRLQTSIMKKKPEQTFVIHFRDVDPYTGHIDSEGITCRTSTEAQAESIIAALIEYNTHSKQGNPNRQYLIKIIVEEVQQEEKNHWWTW